MTIVVPGGRELRLGRLLVVLFAVAVALILALAGCGDEPGANARAGSGGGFGDPGVALPADDPGAVRDDLPAFALVDQAGDPFGSAELKGTTWIGSFVFTRCAGPCPRITADMAWLQDRLADTAVELVSFSVDPRFDTPAVLARYGESHGADFERWHFLTGEQLAVHEVVQQGFWQAVAVNPDGLITHSESLVVVDGEGRLRGVYDASERTGRTRALERALFVAGETL